MLVFLPRLVPERRPAGSFLGEGTISSGFACSLADLSQEDIDEIDNGLGILNDAGGLEPAMYESKDFKSAHRVEFIGGDGIELFVEGGVDDDQMVEVLLVGLKFNGKKIAEQLHSFELVVESAVFRVK